MKAPVLFSSSPSAISFVSSADTRAVIEGLGWTMSLDSIENVGGIILCISPQNKNPNLPHNIEYDFSPKENCRKSRFRNRIVITENLNNSNYFCEIDRYSTRYHTDVERLYLVPTIVNGLLSLLSEKVFLIHGALISNNEDCFLLNGRSGSGKTTAATRVPVPWKCLADDMIAAVWTGSSYHFYPLPTWSRLYTDPASFSPTNASIKYDIKNIYFLNKSQETYVSAISRSEVISRFVKSSFQLYDEYWKYLSAEEQIQLKRNVLMHSVRLVETLKCRFLHLTKDGNYWDLLGQDSIGDRR